MRPIPAQLQTLLRKKGYDVIVANEGISGDTTAGALKRFDAAIAPGTDIVLVEFGVNDLRQHVSPRRMRANLNEIVKTLRKRKIEVLLIGLGSLDLSARRARQWRALRAMEIAAGQIPRTRQCPLQRRGLCHPARAHAAADRRAAAARRAQMTCHVTCTSDLIPASRRKTPEDSKPKKIIAKLILAPPGALIMRASCFVTEGCLISILRHETGSGGRGMTWWRRCSTTARRSKPQRPGAPAVRHWAA